VARVCVESYPDPTIDDERWLVVDVEPVVALNEPVTLAAIKAEPTLAEMALVRRGRLSVVPVERLEFQRVLSMGKTKLPRAAATKASEKKPRGRG
jgi:predicted RNA-binding protein with PUA-like domain